MTADETDWLRGEGKRPRLVWSFATEGPLVAMHFARESGEVIAGDGVGGLYRLDRQGKLQGMTHAPGPIRELAWSDTGAGGLALVGDGRLCWLDGHLAFQGTIEQADPILGVALDPYGHYAVASLSSCANIVYDANRKLVRRFSSMQPLSKIEFLIQQPALLAITEYGMLCCHDFGGQPLWQQQLFANVGDFSFTGDGQSILLACYAHGIQCHNARGAQIGSYQLGGTVSKVSSSFVKGRIAAATVERSLHYLDAAGTIIWQTLVPDEVWALACDPFGHAVVCGFRSGRIVRIEWLKAE